MNSKLLVAAILSLSFVFNASAETAQEIAKYHTDAELILTEDLREKRHGIHEGVRVDSFGDTEWATATNSQKLTMRVEGGETWQEVFDRVKTFIEQVSDLHIDETVLIVAHGGINCAITCFVTGRPSQDMFDIEHTDNTSITIFEIDQDKNHKIHLLNCTKHLE